MESKKLPDSSFEESLKSEIIFNSGDRKIVQLRMKKDAILPEHHSPVDTCLLVIQGEISFSMGGKDYSLSENMFLNFPAMEKHSVKCIEDSVFLLYR